MAKHDFSRLFDQYPIIIEQLPYVFTSHQFILKLAQQNQNLYIEALYAYRYNEDGETHTPFMTVHGILAKELNYITEMIEIVRNDAPSKDLFGHPSKCALWRKLN